MEPWLKLADFTTWLGKESELLRDLAKRLNAIVSVLIRIELANILGRERLSEMQSRIKSDTQSEVDKKLMVEIVPYLVFAAWAEFTLNGNIIDTEVGPKNKETDWSEKISDGQRLAEHKRLIGRAESLAIRLVKLVADDKDCAVSTTSVVQRKAKTIRKPVQSRFDD